MRRIDLTPYAVGRDTQGNLEEFRLRESLAGILFHPNQRINARENLARCALADKIEGCDDYELLLEEADYRKLVTAVETFEGFLSRSHGEMIRRVLDAEEVAVRAIK